MDEKLRSVLCLLKYVQNRDVFMRYHKGHLSRRLILDTSADCEKEEDMVDWLRGIGMPADYVNKLSRMFQVRGGAFCVDLEPHSPQPLYLAIEA